MTGSAKKPYSLTYKTCKTCEKHQTKLKPTEKTPGEYTLEKNHIFVKFVAKNSILTPTWKTT